MSTIVIVSVVALTFGIVALAVYGGRKLYEAYESRPKNWAVCKETLTRKGRKPWSAYSVHEVSSLPPRYEEGVDGTVVEVEVVSKHDSYSDAASVYFALSR